MTTWEGPVPLRLGSRTKSGTQKESNLRPSFGGRTLSPRTPKHCFPFRGQIRSGIGAEHKDSGDFAKAPPLRLSPRIQSYDWGDPFFIPKALGLEASGEPRAEAWFGAHPLSPADVLVQGSWQALDELIAKRPASILGDAVHARFGGLPYLLKLLAAARPLSIQVHADRPAAQAGFELEERAGIPLSAPHRRYRDSNHKPEVLLALTDVYALCGFRPLEEIPSVLGSLPELRRLLPKFDVTPQGLRDLLTSYFALPTSRLLPSLARLLERLEREERRLSLGPEDPRFWALRAHRELARNGTPDPGLKLVFLLSLVHLSPGQAVFMPPGAPHAYLQGAGLELMATSDNVLRAGLTSKYVDTGELLRVLRYEACSPVVLEPRAGPEGLEETYDVPAEELGLGRLHLDSGVTVTREASGPETLLVLADGPGPVVRVDSAGGGLDLRGGEACLLADGARYTLRAASRATVYRAHLPAPLPPRT